MYVSSSRTFTDKTEPAVAAGLKVPTPAAVRQVAAGLPLYHEGDQARTVFEIMEGVVRTSKLLSNGKRQIISFYYPGDVVGLSHDSAYHTECEAVTDVQLRVVVRNAASIRFDADPLAADALLHHATMEISNLQEHFLMLGCKSATERIASFLISMVHRNGRHGDCCTLVSLPMKRADIADYLGVTIETVSRTLTKLKRSGMITLPDPHCVCIKDLKALKSVSERR